MNEITPANGALMSFIERAAKDESFDVAKFETLLRVRRDEAHDQSRRVFNAAMAACQSEMEPVLRGSTNPDVRSKYAKLEAIDQQMRPVYTRHGFSVRFGSAPPPQPGWMRITCTVAHDGGYFEENYLDSPVTTQGSQGGRIAMTPVQAVGSVVTYLRRYLLGMVFNIVQADVVGEDNDGEGQRDEFIPVTKSAPRLNTPRAPKVTEKAAPAGAQPWAQWAAPGIAELRQGRRAVAGLSPARGGGDWRAGARATDAIGHGRGWPPPPRSEEAPGRELRPPPGRAGGRGADRRPGDPRRGEASRRLNCGGAVTDRYILDETGEPVPCPDLLTWGRWFEASQDRHVARDEIGDVLISTVFLGLDHGWGRGPPVLWETMVFGGKLDEQQERYVSRADALAGHTRWLAKARGGIR